MRNIILIALLLVSSTAFCETADFSKHSFEVYECSDGSYGVQSFVPSFIEGGEGTWFVRNDCGLTYWAALREKAKGEQLLKELREMSEESK